MTLRYARARTRVPSAVGATISIPSRQVQRRESQCASIKLMNRARGAKQSHGVPWTFVASGRYATPRRVPLSRVAATSRGARVSRTGRKVTVSNVGRRLEKAFVQAVRTVKRNAAKRA